MVVQACNWIINAERDTTRADVASG